MLLNLAHTDTKLVLYLAHTKFSNVIMTESKQFFFGSTGSGVLTIAVWSWCLHDFVNLHVRYESWSMIEDCKVWMLFWQHLAACMVQKFEITSPYIYENQNKIDLNSCPDIFLNSTIYSTIPITGWRNFLPNAFLLDLLPLLYKDIVLVQSITLQYICNFWSIHLGKWRNFRTCTAVIWIVGYI